MNQGHESRAAIVEMSIVHVRKLLLGEAHSFPAHDLYYELPTFVRERLPRRPKPQDFTLGEPAQAISMMTINPQEIRRQSQRWAAAQHKHQPQIGEEFWTNWAELSLRRSEGGHYVFPLRYRDQKIAEVWTPASEVVEVPIAGTPSEELVTSLSYYRVIPEKRELMDPRVALVRSGLRLDRSRTGAESESIRLYWWGSSRGLELAYAVPTPEGWRFVSAHAGRLRLYAPVEPQGRGPSYTFQGKPIELVEVSP